jgi:SAM-dependent methyltransferase
MMVSMHPMSVNVNTRMRWTVLRKLPFVANCKGKRVLDLAAGLGFFSAQLAEAGAEVLATDVHESSLRYLSENFVLPVALLDLEHEEYPTGPFDLIFLGEVLEHLHAPGEAVAKAAKCLAPGGVLLLTTPALEGPLINTPGKRLGHAHGAEKHEREGFTQQELTRLVQDAGLIPQGHVYSIFYFSELFMQLTKLIYLLKSRSYGGQADMVASMNSISYKALRAIYALVHPIFLAEEVLCRALNMRGNCHILWAVKP